MKRIDLEDGGYKLVAGEGKQLIIVDDEGNEIRMDNLQEVSIPSGETLHNWKERSKTTSTN